jgi:hypothetical protein
MITKRERLTKACKHLRQMFMRHQGPAVPVLIFGEQRSGTNMLLRCFDSCTATAMYNETDDDAFVDYELRDLAEIRSLVARSPASHVVLKPTVDGNRADEIIDGLPGARAIWIYRGYQDAINSALVLFQETSLQYLQNVASRSPAARWRSINITDQDVEFISSHLDRGLSEQSARALIWTLRNGFFFRRGLDRRQDVLLLNYEELVRDPVSVVGRAYRFVGLEFRQPYVRNVFASSVGKQPGPAIDPEVERLCVEMQRRLDDCRQLSLSKSP